ncbi:MAG: DUF5684 domain-containing protein [bacterium]
MNSTSSFPPSLIATICVLAFLIVLLCISLWKIFEKAGRPGWNAIVPILHTVVYLEIAGRPWWWFFLMFIPLIGMIVSVIATVDFAKNFGKNNWFAVGLIVLPFVFFPILAFGKARYEGEEFETPLPINTPL